jgi:hypothetical protein
MSTAALVSLQEYLATTYHPDCDYVDGVLVERNVGQKDHSKLQGEVFAWFRSRRRALGLAAFVGQRIQVAPRRYRVPEVCVVPLPEPAEQIFTRALYLCRDSVARRRLPETPGAARRLFARWRTEHLGARSGRPPRLEGHARRPLRGARPSVAHKRRRGGVADCRVVHARRVSLPIPVLLLSYGNARCFRS